MSHDPDTRQLYARLSCGHVTLLVEPRWEYRLPRKIICEVCEFNARVKSDDDQPALKKQYRSQFASAATPKPEER